MPAINLAVLQPRGSKDMTPTATGFLAATIILGLILVILLWMYHISSRNLAKARKEVTKLTKKTRDKSESSQLLQAELTEALLACEFFQNAYNKEHKKNQEFQIRRVNAGAVPTSANRFANHFDSMDSVIPKSAHYGAGAEFEDLTHVFEAEMVKQPMGRSHRGNIPVVDIPRALTYDATKAAARKAKKAQAAKKVEEEEASFTTWGMNEHGKTPFYDFSGISEMGMKEALKPQQLRWPFSGSDTSSDAESSHAPTLMTFASS
ncbi:hypothetical protein B0T10DRAFT_554733 [Thelonectria olida]|uniref:Uncharacterized protein n=1 Tax=Thelonectria olida TaxID=1576542 RepID=A0A9P9AXG3_9HYPO|nr:hypothetical protein B0T10DRAFT_554733 [Thelonectria olida]